CYELLPALFGGFLSLGYLAAGRQTTGTAETPANHVEKFITGSKDGQHTNSFCAQNEQAQGPRPLGLPGLWPEDQIKPRSKISEILCQTHQAVVFQRQWIFTWASVPGQMYLSGLRISTATR